MLVCLGKSVACQRKMESQMLLPSAKNPDSHPEAHAEDGLTRPTGLDSEFEEDADGEQHDCKVYYQANEIHQLLALC